MDYDVIVLGVGAMGAATLEQLSRRGLSVLGLEQSTVPNSDGSSGGDTRLIRKAYFEHPDYVPLLQRAYQGWRDIQARAGEQLLFETGALYLGAPDGELIAGSARAAREHGLELEALSNDEVQRFYPQFRVLPGSVAAFEPEAGFVLAGRAISAFASLAGDQGATIHCQTRVTGWSAMGNEIEVRTSSSTHRAGHLIVTAGSWSSGLLDITGLALTVTRQPVFWIAPDQPEQFQLERFPCWAAEHQDHDGMFYGFPGAIPNVARTGVKFAHHHPGTGCSPDAPRTEPSSAEYEALRGAVANVVPGLEGAPVGAMACLYTLSRDQHFIIDRHPEHANVTFAAGFSGHGFKFAPVIGELLADHALYGGSQLPGEFLRIAGRSLWQPGTPS